MQLQLPSGIHFFGIHAKLGEPSSHNMWNFTMSLFTAFLPLALNLMRHCIIHAMSPWVHHVIATAIDSGFLSCWRHCKGRKVKDVDLAILLTAASIATASGNVATKESQSISWKQPCLRFHRMLLPTASESLKHHSSRCHLGIWSCVSGSITRSASRPRRTIAQMIRYVGFIRYVPFRH